MVKLEVNIKQQQLNVFDSDSLIKSYDVSTAKNGVGNQINSGQTPIGKHKIIACIGRGMPENTVFVSREPTGEIYNQGLAVAEPNRDWILTRILWLAGCETGINQGGEVDTASRFIYIHGCPDNEPMGAPLSHGCIRMRNVDVIDLFDRVTTNTPVEIYAS